jgi:hypothetical protein
MVYELWLPSHVLCWFGDSFEFSTEDVVVANRKDDTVHLDEQQIVCLIHR